jgi:HEAT repeat protein
MIRTGLIISSAALATAFFAPTPYRIAAQGGDLARRITSAPDGLVKMSYASREEICGDGRSFIADNSGGTRNLNVWFMDGMSMSGTMNDFSSRCARGPVRLLLVVRDHRVIDVQPFVGPPSVATSRAGTDLGTVGVTDVSRYLLDLAAHSFEKNARNAILAAAIADSVRLAAPLASIARNKSLAAPVREGALKWVGKVAAREGDRDAMRVARTILEDNDDDIAVRERAIRVIGEDEADGPSYLRTLYRRVDEPTLRERIVRVVGESGTKSDIDWIRSIALDRSERTSIRERAVRVVGEASDTRGLRELYDKLEDPSLRERIIRSMAEIGDAEGRRWLREIVERSSESSSNRERAIRSLAEQGDVAYLRGVYRTLDDEGLRERIVRSVAEAGGSDAAAWLRTIVRDPKESSGLRDRAVRSLADAGVPTSELVSLYDAVSDRSVRDRLVSVLADRGDRTARDKLRSIAADDPDEDLRRRATRKLAEK